MRIIILLLTATMLSGCFMIFKDDEKVKILGEDKEYAVDTLNKIYPAEPQEGQAIEQQQEEAVPERIK